MEFTVHLHTILQIETPEGLIRKLNLTTDSEISIDELILHLNITADPSQTLFVINGQICTPGTIITNGDEVHLIPAISGGGNS